MLFSGLLLFKSEIAGAENVGLFSELAVVIVSASDKPGAISKATSFGHEQSTSFQNSDEETVRYSFYKLLDLYEHDEATAITAESDVITVFSKFLPVAPESVEQALDDFDRKLLD